jgi:hypothetical protein
MKLLSPSLYSGKRGSSLFKDIISWNANGNQQTEEGSCLIVFQLILLVATEERGLLHRKYTCLHSSWRSVHVSLPKQRAVKVYKSRGGRAQLILNFATRWNISPSVRFTFHPPPNAGWYLSSFRGFTPVEYSFLLVYTKQDRVMWAGSATASGPLIHSL